MYPERGGGSNFKTAHFLWKTSQNYLNHFKNNFEKNVRVQINHVMKLELYLILLNELSSNDRRFM